MSNFVGLDVVSTPLKQQNSVDNEMPTASTMGSSLTGSSFAPPLSVTRSKISFMDMVAANFEGDETKFIKEFAGWLDTHSRTKAMKPVSPDIPQLKFDL
jgi:hypothetical protein